MSKITPLIEMCKFEEDTSTWEDITSSLFNGLDYETLSLWPGNRDGLIFHLISKKSHGNKTATYNPHETVENYFNRETDGRLITKYPLYINDLFTDKYANVTIAKKPIFLGEGVELLDTTIRTSVYVGDRARLINSKILSTKNKIDEASYIGKGTTIEDATQFCKSVVGSGIKNYTKYPFSYIHTAINGAIIGGSVAISNGVGWQSHWTETEKTKLIDIENPEKIINPFERLLNFSKKFEEINPIKELSRFPTIIGCNTRIGGGVQIVSPLIISADQIIGEDIFEDRRILKGFFSNGHHYRPFPEKLNSKKYFVKKD